VRKPAFLFATAAVAWGAGFFAWALLGGAYSNGEPLARAGDPVQVALVALPLLVAVAAWWTLHRSCALGASRRPAAAIAVVGGAFALVSAASVGLLLAPLTLFVALSVATVETR
jgi:hypothetical protein